MTTEAATNTGPYDITVLKILVESSKENLCSKVCFLGQILV